MKKKLLICVFALFGLGANSQVILSVEQPSSIAAIYNSGNFELTYATQAQSWSVSDLTIPSNSVNAQVVLASDLSGTADSLMCTSANPGSLNGKIALLYRGTCSFGVKALNAQNAGAIGVIIVNNVAGNPFEFSGGTEGLSVSIPIVMVSNVTGALMKAKLDNNETVEAYIGSLVDYYDVDLGSSPNDIMVSSAQAMPIELVQDPTQFPINLGIKVRNHGNLAQVNSRVNVTIKRNGTTIFNVNSPNFNLNSGDTLWVNNFPGFSPASYLQGEYLITYTVITVATDQNLGNNTVITKFNITSDLYSSAKINANGFPNASGYSYSNSTTTNFETCINFRNLNSEAVGAEGLYFSAAGVDLTGANITIKAYSWDVDFANILDPNYAYWGITPIASANYVFASNLQQTTVYKAFDIPVTLLNDQRYLFCVSSTNPLLAFGFDNETKYNNSTLNLDPQPVSPLNINGSWYTGFTGDPVAAIGLKTFPCPTMVAAPTSPLGDIICNNESAVVSATALPNSNLHWFTSPNPPYIASSIGSSYTTPNLSMNTSYWVAQVNNGCNLLSPMIEVMVTVNQNTTSTIFESTCENSFGFNGNTFFVSGTYEVIIPNANGCDSLISLHLTFLPSLTGNNPQEICTGGSYTINGNTYTTAGTYTDVLQSLVSGCDSIVTTTLAIVTSFNVSQNITICQGENIQVGTSIYSTPGTYTNLLISTLGCDSTVTTVLTVNPTFASNNPQTICQGESYSIGGSVYTASGTYIDVFQAMNGCDSTVTTALIVNPIYAVNNPQTICAGETYAIGGSTYTTAGTYSDVLQAMNSCDSTVTTILTVNPLLSSNNPQTICQGESYTINGNNYTTAGTYTDVLQSLVTGCDSTVTTVLVVNATFASNNPQMICSNESYTVGGSTYTTAGTYVDILQAVNGCDSTVTTVLTVKPIYNVNNPQVICQGETYSINGHNYTTAGTYSDVFQSVSGCDSTIVTILTVNPTFAVNNPQVICAGESYAINGNTYTTAGTYTDVMQSENGCDSTVTTVLTINDVQFDLGVTQSGTVLTSAHDAGSYQWIDCDNNDAPISGATAQTYTVTVNGNYAVILTECGESDTSACILVDDLGIADKQLNLNVQLYPNPTNDHVTVSVVGTNLTQLTVTDLNGKILSQQSVSGHTSEISVNDLRSGVYLVNIVTENGTAVRQFVKH